MCLSTPGCTDVCLPAAGRPDVTGVDVLLPAVRTCVCVSTPDCTYVCVCLSTPGCTDVCVCPPQAVQMLLELPLNLMTTSPAHIPNWDLVAEVVNTSSRTYRSAKQCKNRYENVIVPREEGRILYDINPRKQKKSKGIYKVFLFVENHSGKNGGKKLCATHAVAVCKCLPRMEMMVDKIVSYL